MNKKEYIIPLSHTPRDKNVGSFPIFEHKTTPTGTTLNPLGTLRTRNMIPVPKNTYNLIDLDLIKTSDFKYWKLLQKHLVAVRNPKLINSLETNINKTLAFKASKNKESNPLWQSIMDFDKLEVAANNWEKTMTYNEDLKGLIEQTSNYYEAILNSNDSEKMTVTIDELNAGKEKLSVINSELISFKNLESTKEVFKYNPNFKQEFDDNFEEFSKVLKLEDKAIKNALKLIKTQVKIPKLPDNVLE